MIDANDTNALWSRIAQNSIMRNRWAEGLAEKNDPRGLHELAQVLRYGWGGYHVDYSRSFDLYMEAAKLGHAGAAYELTRLYLQGDCMMGIKKNIKAARECANLVLGHPDANDVVKFNTNIYSQEEFLDSLKSLYSVIGTIEKIEARKAVPVFSQDRSSGGK